MRSLLAVAASCVRAAVAASPFAASCLLLVAVSASGQVPGAPAGAARDLPSTVVNAFQKAYPGASITGASQERQDGRIVFRVDAMDKARRRVLVYSLEGSVLESAEQVNESELPAKVAAAMHAHPKASFVKGMRVTRGLSVNYELTLRGTRKTTMIVKPDGAVVSFR